MDQKQKQCPANWRVSTLIGFRFGFAYWLLYLLPVRLVPGGSAVWDWLVGQAGLRFFHMQVERVQRTGSGDTRFDYAEVLCSVVLAVITAVVWTVVDWRRQRYERLPDLLRSLLRFTLAFWMLRYGVAKFPTEFSQFPPPEIGRLFQPYGESSPMGLLWTFMGASKAYTFFAGLSECLGGVLLLFRRTATLGALVTAGVMTHVAVLNFCYDVPVKLFSMQLVLMAVCVAAPDARRLLNVFLLNRSCEPVAPRVPYRTAWLNPVHVVGKWLLVFYLLALGAGRQVIPWLQGKSQTEADTPACFGTYAVERFEKNGVEVPPLLADSSRWQRVALRRYPDYGSPTGDTSGAVDYLNFTSMAGGTTSHAVRWQPGTHELRVKPGADTNVPLVFKYSDVGTNLLTLEVEMPDGVVKAQLKRIERSQFLLINRGFHWINEHPFNR